MVDDAEDVFEDTPHVPVFSNESEVDAFGAALGLEISEVPGLQQEDGSIVLAIGDRAITLERHDAVGGVVITALIARTAGPELDGVIHDLMALNARPQTTGGLTFGVLADDIVVATLIVAEAVASPTNVADAVEAVIEATDVWRALIEQAGAAARSTVDEAVTDEPVDKWGPTDLV